MRIRNIRFIKSTPIGLKYLYEIFLEEKWKYKTGKIPWDFFSQYIE